MKTPLTKCNCSICVGFRIVLFTSLAVALLIVLGVLTLVTI